MSDTATHVNNSRNNIVNYLLPKCLVLQLLIFYIIHELEHYHFGSNDWNYLYGKNIYLQGETTVGEITRPDECYDGSKVIESYCLDESTENTEIIDCPNGFVCEAGVCKSQIVPKEFIAAR